MESSKFSSDYLKLAYEEAEKALLESLLSYREIINKSYIAAAFYVSAIVYLIDMNEISAFRIILSIASAISCFIILLNLISAKMYSPGTEPRYSVHEYFLNSENQIDKFLVTRLEDVDQKINFNYKEVGKRNARFKWSAGVFILALIISSFYVFTGIR